MVLELQPGGVTMPTLAEEHDAIAKKLRIRGEDVWSPNPHFDRRRRPDVYVKARKFGTPAWLSGTAFDNHDGTYNISAESIADLIGEGPFKLSELGLCDPMCGHANNDPDTYPEYYPARPRPKTCPTCGHVLEG
jgi:hypothetical protein